jgi:hypothetical protein
VFIDSCGSRSCVDILSSARKKWAFIVEERYILFMAWKRENMSGNKDGSERNGSHSKRLSVSLKAQSVSGVVADKKALAKGRRGRKRKR